MTWCAVGLAGVLLSAFGGVSNEYLRALESAHIKWLESSKENESGNWTMVNALSKPVDVAAAVDDAIDGWMD